MNRGTLSNYVISVLATISICASIWFAVLAPTASAFYCDASPTCPGGNAPTCSCSGSGSCWTEKKCAYCLCDSNPTGIKKECCPGFDEESE